MSGGYKVNEKDIDTVLGILRKTNPEATPEQAIDILEDLKSGIHNLVHTNPELLEEIQKELEKDKPSQN